MKCLKITYTCCTYMESSKSTMCCYIIVVEKVKSFVIFNVILSRDLSELNVLIHLISFKNTLIIVSLCEYK